MRAFDELLMDAALMHRGCVCPGQVLGVRMAILGCRLLNIDEPSQNKRLIAYVEIDRCLADAIAAVTGCRLGKRTLKHVDYGKCACTFVDTVMDRAVRILARDDARNHAWGYAPPGLNKNDTQREAYKIMSDDELFVVQGVVVDIPNHDRPGSSGSRVPCASCGEMINDHREVWVHGELLCRACALGCYYRIRGLRTAPPLEDGSNRRLVSAVIPG
jgi:formylmethanofuran dehydrogenase subunit E